MAVQSIQSSNISNNRYCNVGGAALFGFLAGNAAHDIMPLSKNAISKSQLRDLARYTRTSSYNRLYKELSAKDELTIGQKKFVQMVDSGEINKAYARILAELKDNSTELKVFKNLNWLANVEAAGEARNLLGKHIKISKLERPIFPFLIAGTVLFTVGAMVYNAMAGLVAEK